MADNNQISRLAELREFDELKKHFDEKREAEIDSLARKTFANPEAHDRLEWEKKHAFYEGVKAVLGYPQKAREAVIRNQNERG